MQNFRKGYLTVFDKYRWAVEIYQFGALDYPRGL